MIDKDKWYSVQDIRKGKLLPMFDTEYKIKRWIEKGYLKGNTVGIGQGKRYFIRGEHLISFLTKWESGDFHS